MKEDNRGGENKNSKDSDDEPEQLRKLFVGGLSYDTTDEGLREFYEQYGEIVDCVVMKESKTRVSRGFGFVTYASLSMVDEAMANRPHHIDGRKVQPKRAIPREICDRTTANIRKLFIGGLSKSVEKEDLEEYFGKFGKMTDCAVVIAKGTGEKRGFGFVEYDDVDAADKVVLIKNHELKGRQVEVKKALPREESDGRGGGGGRDRGGERGDRGSRDRGGDRRGGGRDSGRGSDRDGPRSGRGGGGGGGGGDDYRGGNWSNNQGGGGGGGWGNGGGGNFNSPWGNNQGAPQGWGGSNMGGGSGGGGGGGGGGNNWNNPWGDSNQGGPSYGNSGMGGGNMGGSGGYNKGGFSGGFSGDSNGPVYQTPSNFNNGGGGGGGGYSSGGFGNQSGGAMGGSGGPIRSNYNSSNRSAPYSSGGSYGGRN